MKANKPLLSVLFTFIILASITIVFSNKTIGEWLTKRGIYFTNLNNFSFYLEKNKPKFKPQPRRNSELVASVKNLDKSLKKSIDTLKNKVHFLENFVSADNTCLDYFFKSLTTSKNDLVHIWYYGDSQIEGDRLTGELRYYFQGKFGGNGTGYVPFSDLASYRYFELKPGNSLVKFNCFNNKAPKGYGFAGKIYSFNSADSQSLAQTGLIISPYLKYDNFYLLTGKHPGGMLTLSSKDSTIIQKEIPPCESAQRVLLTANRIKGPITINLPASGNYAGISFDGSRGVQVDNCGIRGHSGDGLRFIASDVVSSEAKTWNTKLVIFHFGNNMIPVIKGDKASMSYYTRHFIGIFSRFKKLMPEASFLVVSAGDMGTIVEEEEVGYPNIPQFVEAMRTAAIQSGCAFFDAHSMIKKDGGILGWKKKGYAGLDGHLSFAGQQKFAATLYGELMREYEIYNLIHQTP